MGTALRARLEDTARGSWAFVPVANENPRDTDPPSLRRTTASRCSTRCTRWARAVLKQISEVDEIELTMPNLHCLLVVLSRFGQDNPNFGLTSRTERLKQRFGGRRGMLRRPIRATRRRGENRNRAVPEAGGIQRGSRAGNAQDVSFSPPMRECHREIAGVADCRWALRRNS